MSNFLASVGQLVQVADTCWSDPGSASDGGHLPVLAQVEVDGKENERPRGCLKQ